MAISTESTILRIMLLILLIGAVKSDLSKRKIPNRLTMSFVLIGLGFHGILDFPKGIFFSGLGIVAGFLVFLIPYMMKAMGAGDVKLMAALGALTGLRTIIFIALFTTVAGGIIILVARATSGGMKRTLKRTRDLFLFYFFSFLAIMTNVPTMEARKDKYRIDISDKKNDYIPYALAISSGVVITFVLSILNVIQGLSI